jgi:uncharacterized protein
MKYWKKPAKPDKIFNLERGFVSEPLQKETFMPCPVVHFEIGCRDSAKTAEFVCQLFDWKTEASGPAVMINTGSSEGIQGHITALGQEPYNYVTFYAQVDNLEAYLDKASSLGGKTLVPPVDIGYGSFAWVGDPDGNVIGLWKPKS